jgi:L-fucose mutarotase/ribose pyranase (RbsD/FucU family)
MPIAPSIVLLPMCPKLRATEAAPTTMAMRKLFPLDTYVHQNQGEIRAEWFAEYLTGDALRKSVERQYEAILRRVRHHDPEAANLIERHRTNFLSKKHHP